MGVYNVIVETIGTMETKETMGTMETMETMETKETNNEIGEIGAMTVACSTFQNQSVLDLVPFFVPVALLL